MRKDDRDPDFPLTRSGRPPWSETRWMSDSSLPDARRRDSRSGGTRGGSRSGGPRPGGPRGSGRGPGQRGGGPRGRGRRAGARGDIRVAVLTLLAEQEMHGYQLMSEISERSSGAWTPSPGSIYPLLQQLTDEDLVTSHDDGGRKVFTLTDAGREAAEAAVEASPDIWSKRSSDRADAELGHASRALMDAVGQVVRIGTASQIEQAEAIVTEARKRLYQLLASD